MLINVSLSGPSVLILASRKIGMVDPWSRVIYSVVYWDKTYLYLYVYVTNLGIGFHMTQPSSEIRNTNSIFDILFATSLPDYNCLWTMISSLT